jgi:ABC-type transporter Mla maintaining outer membrane lipid asymmetry ATPase subunit MlaF
MIEKPGRALILISCACAIFWPGAFVFGFTGVMVTHEIPDVFYISQRIAMQDQGRIIFQGSPAEIQDSDEPVIRQFIRGQDTGAIQASPSGR